MFVLLETSFSLAPMSTRYNRRDALSLDQIARIGSHRRLRSVVAAAAADRLSLHGESAGVECRVLCPGAPVQLSALHGDDLPRLSHAGRLCAISSVDGLCHGIVGRRVDCSPLVGVACGVAVHDLRHLEPVALHRPRPGNPAPCLPRRSAHCPSWRSRRGPSGIAARADLPLGDGRARRRRRDRPAPARATDHRGRGGDGGRPARPRAVSLHRRRAAHTAGPPRPLGPAGHRALTGWV